MDKNSGHIPDSWISVPLEALAADTKYPIGDGDHGQIKPACYTDFGIPYIRVADLGWGTFEPNGLVYIPESVHEHNLKSELRPGDILIAKTGATIGKCCIVPASMPRANTTSSVGKVTVNHDLILPKWIICYFLSGSFKEKMWAVSKKTAQPGFNIINLKKFVVPVPPIAEQHRIVAKVDELMALCDQLEQQQTHSIEAHRILVETLLGTLTRVEPQQEFSTAWAHIASNFDTLFTTESSIDRLKQTLLQLAVMGKLVLQDPNDEPASVLLVRIAAEKERLLDEGKVKKQKTLSLINNEDKLFDLPQGWEWVRLGDIAILKGGFAYSSTAFTDNGNHQVIRMGNVRPDYLRLEENPAFIPEKLGNETSEYLIESNDILLTMTGTKGKRDYLYSLVILPEHLADRKLYLNQRLCIVRALLIAPEFIGMEIKDNRLLDAIYAQSTGTANQANIGMVALNNWVLPLPPVEEQRRIVAKVDGLMALCDALKTRLADAQAIQIHLADAIVEQAVC